MPVRAAVVAIGLLINLAGNKGVAAEFLRPIEGDRAVNRHMQTVLEYREMPLLASYYLIGGTNENYKTEGTPIGRTGRQELLYLFSRETPRRSFYKEFVWEYDDPRGGMITQSGFECLIASVVIRTLAVFPEPGRLEPDGKGWCSPEVPDLGHDRQETSMVSGLRGTLRFDIFDGKPRTPNGNRILSADLVGFVRCFGQIGHFIGGPFGFSDGILNVGILGSDSLRAPESGISGGFGGTIRADQEVSLPNAGGRERQREDGQEKRVEGNRIVRRPVPQGFLMLLVWGGIAGIAITSTILGVATFISNKPKPPED